MSWHKLIYDHHMIQPKYDQDYNSYTLPSAGIRLPDANKIISTIHHKPNIPSVMSLNMACVV